jgi:stearoyl-CoA desaturase (Delta-9 desaturase)
MSTNEVTQARRRMQSVPGVATLNARQQAIWKYLVLTVVTIPFLSFLIAIFLLWRLGVDWVAIASLMVMYTLTLLGISVGFHRHLAHRSFQTSAPARIVLVALGSMAVQGPILTWAALHRRHHRYSDRTGDPHSPYVYADGSNIRGMWRGLWHSHLGWLFSADVNDWGHFVPDLLRDKTLFKLHRMYFVFVITGLILPAAAVGLINASWSGALAGFLWGGLARICLVHHASWTVGSLSHMYGSQPFNTQDHSRNNAWLSLVTFGDSWQNNHHAFPSSALHGLKWWQLDPSGWVIKALWKAGIIWNVDIPASHLIEARQKRR